MTVTCPLCREPADASVVRIGGSDITVIGCPCVEARDLYVVAQPVPVPFEITMRAGWTE